MCLTSFYKALFVVVLLLWVSCANIVPPTGGKLDSSAPKLLSIKPQDSLLNAKVTQIDLKFDEYITVGDVAKEVQVSPLLTQNPTMSVKGKTVSLKIPDSLLRNNTTYTISFGNSIKDLHEGNPYTGKTFMFSTGAWFDSLSIKGRITDAATGQPDSSSGVKILLYDAQEDSDVVLRKKPLYITSSRSGGNFSFKGLPQNRFRIFALKENNESLKFDADEEYIGFTNQIIETSKDTAAVHLYIFKEIPDSTKSSNKDSLSLASKGGYGLKKTRFNANKESDKIPNLDPKSFNYLLNVDTNNRNKRTQDITKVMELYTSRPIDTFDATKIMLTADSNGIELEQKVSLSIDTSRKKLLLSPTWQDNIVYTLRLLKGFVQDTGRNSAMPSKYSFRSKAEEDYGKIDINMPAQYVGQTYVVQVKNEDKVIYQEAITQQKITLNRLTPGKYTLLIFEDLNQDGEWTTGDLKKGRQAERVIPYEAGAISMKAGWEHVIDFEPIKKEIKK